MQKDEAQIQRVRELLDRKTSQAEIARLLGRSRQLVSQIIRLYLPPSYAASSRKRKAKPKRLRSRARAGGKLRGGKLQVVCYATPRTKKLLLKASREANLGLMNYLLIAGLEKAGALGAIPTSEFKKLSRAEG